MRRSQISRIIRIGLLLSLSGAAGSRGNAETPVYEKDIRPIFRAHCFDCHGATEQMEGGLDLRLVRFMEQGGESGPAIVAGKPEQSYLLDRLLAGEMPPGEKKVPADQIEIVRRWIAAGAETARPEPDSIGPGLGVTPEERAFWSFRPIRRPEVPPLESFPKEARARTPIDALLLLHGDGLRTPDSRRSDSSADDRPRTLAFHADADRRTLVVRAHFDLTGLPPSPEEVEKRIADAGDDWYDRLLTELLDSPHYGERWARHWLDVAGYADSEGSTPADAERPWAWKYRDWVIRGLNDDKPLDRFVTEQLAGDELAGPKNGDWTDEQIELLTATGFLRMAADGTGSGANDSESRNQVIADTLKIVGTSLLGLSLQCAQCHDHRYDPIPQVDYYGLRAVFEPALDWTAWQGPAQRRVSLYTEADRRAAAEVEEEARMIAAEKSEKQSEYMRQALEKELEKHDESLRERLRDAYLAKDERSDEQKELLKSYPSVNISPGVLYQYLPQAAEDLKRYDRRIEEARAKKPVEQFVRALVEPAGHSPETRLFHRGDHQQPKQTIAPSALTVTSPPDQPSGFPLDDASLPTTGRRLAFARWLTDRENPLFARVIVNRVWMHHFGRGLVATPADFGKLGARPTHPELLDWLADEFMTSGWSLKRLHRLIMTSTAWRQRVESESESPLPRSLIRLEAEAIRDRMLAVSGSLDRALHGPPLAIKEDETGQVVVDGKQTRRSLYVQVRRSRPLAMLQTFDAPVMVTNCESRSNSTVAPQSLMLLNGAFVLEQAAALADRAKREARPLDPERLSRLPPIPQPELDWRYGYGSFDERTNRTASFTPLTHWTGSQWQGGSPLPDPKLGWVLLHADGGHPDVAERSVIRRWIAPTDGTVSVTGQLHHPASAGDGVRSRIVSSRSGRAGEWTAHHGSAETSVSAVEVLSGDTIDFITDCRANHTSDSFSWPVTITLTVGDRPDQVVSSAEQFRGPIDDVQDIPGRIVRAWELAYCRPPSDDELLLAAEFVASQIETLPSSPEAVPEGRTAAGQAMTNLCQSLLSSNEFLYVE